MAFSAPIRDIRFVLEDIVQFGKLAETGVFEDLSADLVEAVLTESGRLAGEVMAPLNVIGDRQGAVLEDGAVRMAPGFAAAYRQYVAGGWNGIAADTAYGGQGLPYSLSIACSEMVYAANLSLTLCPLLTAGAVEVLSTYGSQEQKSLYLAKLVTGEWTATMVLTEPQAGSDVGALRVKATKQSDGSYLIKGTKIYISYGDHDMAENIIHMVLARLPDAPAGTKGISLFLVPKFLVNADGSLGARNDVKPVGLEHKLGIHASPTCVMAFGENQGAVGYLVGGENNGMACMFSMMNAARLNVGLQGVAIAERAYQQALAYARERRQGKSAARRSAQSGPVEIIEHPDVRRMLLTMKATTEAIRAICYANAVAIDEARHLPDDRARAKAKLREELLTPISKGFATDMAVEVASLGIQVHGGMGYIEETGAAQHLRDARILPIYEGTNGIQAMDLATRKLSLNGGAAVAAFIDDMGGCVSQLMNSHSEQLRVIGTCLEQGVAAVDRVTEWLTARLKEHPRDCLSGATPYLRLFGLVSGGYLLGLGAIAANDHLVDGSSGEDGFYKSKISIAKFYAQNILPQAQAWASAAVTGADQLYELTPDQMAG